MKKKPRDPLMCRGGGWKLSGGTGASKQIKGRTRTVALPHHPIDNIHNTTSKQARQPPPPSSTEPAQIDRRRNRTAIANEPHRQAVDGKRPRPVPRVERSGREGDEMMGRKDDRTARKSNWASERVAGGTDDGHEARQAPAPRRHPMPNARMRWRAEGSKQAKPREQPQPRRISPPVVSMRRGG